MIKLKLTRDELELLYTTLVEQSEGINPNQSTLNELLVLSGIMELIMQLNKSYFGFKKPSYKIKLSHTSSLAVLIFMTGRKTNDGMSFILVQEILSDIQQQIAGITNNKNLLH